MYSHQAFLPSKYWSILIANAIIHFDNALYSYLIPIISPLFFPTKSFVVQLILGYSLFITSWLAKPFGVLFFSKIVQLKQEFITLRYTLLGAGVGLMVMGCLPTYEKGLLWSVLGMILSRIVIESCSAGENAVARVYLIKTIDTILAKKLSAWYEATTMIGILFAGATGTLLSFINHPIQYWRFPFIIASLFTLFTLIFLRMGPIDMEKETSVISSHSTEFEPVYLQLWKERKPIMRIAIVTGFSYVTYAIPFIFMNSFVPIITNISYLSMMKHTTTLMVLDILLLVVFGKILKKHDHNNIMAFASGLVALSIIPLFTGLSGASILYVTLFRYWLIFLGIVFSCFLTLWCKEQVFINQSYLTIGFATILGSSLLGKSAPAICFTLFYWYNNLIAPACYIALLACITMLIMVNSASE